MRILFAVVLSYLFGSIPWALIVGKVFYHKDIRKEGSGNLGGTNAGRVLGKKAGISVTLLDGFKAFIAMALCALWAPEAMIYAGLAVCVGHCFPVFAQFRGGKAVATSFGFFLGISVFLTHQIFWQFFFEVICFFVILYICRMVSLSSLLSLAVGVLMSFVLKNDLSVSLAEIALLLFVTYRHRENLVRIKNGTEKKVKWMG